ncbi:DNA gyrase subunit A [Nannocystis radixulma]|uniref:DNA gyrase subunit A n=1 Tax=Nannocystis radixulma TaxID=2995305 RepID=A0ABT5B6Z3_9BACT|nr:DNA gyrase subunit A [Nannocystis radixulma]MDC0669889.1 DNA gyrase subunit A [Nannocystis radixulma]
MASEQKTGINIEDEMRSSFLDYAMSVIISRALPDVRDGLKPVHRRVLYAMDQLRNTHAQPYKKSARVVGDVIGKYHPHGDASVYDALVRLAQDFAMRYPLVDGQGNFGSIDGDAPAAMRYTEVRMKRLTSELLADLDKDTVDWAPNYDDKELEPTVLPTKIPNLLLNGAVGIAVGMATNIPPHNLREIVDACIALVDDPKLPARDLLQIVTGPDFPTGGQIIGRAGIRQAYATGRGSLTLRARCTIEEDEKGREAIIVHEIPYQVNKVRLISHIAELVREKKIEGISDLQDYSDRTGMRIWIQVKRDASAQVVLNSLYKSSDLQVSFGVNMIAIAGGRPQVLSLHECLTHFIDHRRVVVTRRSRYELRKALERREIVEGIGVAIDAIDRIIAIIRAAPDPDAAREALCAEPLSGFSGFLARCGRPEAEVEAARGKPYHLKPSQAKAILDMRLQRLTGLEREKIEGEYKELCATIAYLESILASDAMLMQVIRGELVGIRDEYGDDRRTVILDDESEIEPIDLVADEPMIVMLTNNGYIKRLPVGEYRVQGRGGTGVKGGVGRDAADFVVELFEASAHAHVLMFTNTGRVFRTRVFELPAGRRDHAGKALVNFLDLRDGERVLGMVPYRDADLEGGQQLYVVMCSQQGYIKRTALDEFSNIRSTGIIAVTIEDGDQLIDARLTNGKQQIMLTSAQGMAIRFTEDDVRPMGRTARGVRGQDLREGDAVVSMTVLEPESERSILTMCAKGYGKRTAASDYKVQNRAGLGIITIKVTERNGPVVGTLAVDADDHVMVVTSRGKVIRTTAASISEIGRNTQGVRIIRTGEDERVVAIERIVDREEEAGEAAEPAAGDEPGVEPGSEPGADEPADE